MKRLLKILRDESGRQNEGMILLAFVGIVMAIAVPQTIKNWERYSWWSLLAIPVAAIVIIAIYYAADAVFGFVGEFIRLDNGEI